MSQIAFFEIEQRIMSLSTEDQLLLISRVAEKLRKKAIADSDFENRLEEMANDADIKREIEGIEEDFRYTEMDGLM